MLTLIYFYVYKGKKNVLRTDIKHEDTVEGMVTSRKETKENKPAANKVSFIVGFYALQLPRWSTFWKGNVTLTGVLPQLGVVAAYIGFIHELTRLQEASHCL